MIDAFQFALLVLVCYRIARLLTKEDGPFEVIKRPRSLIMKWGNKDARSGRWYGPGAQLAELFACPYCLGMWIALVMAITVYPEQWLLYWLAIAGGQAYLQGRG